MCTAQFQRLKVQGSSRLHINKKITLNIIQLGAQHFFLLQKKTMLL